MKKELGIKQESGQEVKENASRMGR